MTLPLSGKLSLQDIKDELDPDGSNSPIELSRFYKGGSGVVPDTYFNPDVPTSGSISISDLYAARLVNFNETMTVGDSGVTSSYIDEGDYRVFGYDKLGLDGYVTGRFYYSYGTSVEVDGFGDLTGVSFYDVNSELRIITQLLITENYRPSFNDYQYAITLSVLTENIPNNSDIFNRILIGDGLAEYIRDDLDFIVSGNGSTHWRKSLGAFSERMFDLDNQSTLNVKILNDIDITQLNTKVIELGNAQYSSPSPLTANLEGLYYGYDALDEARGDFSQVDTGGFGQGGFDNDGFGSVDFVEFVDQTGATRRMLQFVMREDVATGELLVSATFDADLDDTYRSDGSLFNQISINDGAVILTPTTVGGSSSDPGYSYSRWEFTGIIFPLNLNTLTQLTLVIT